MLSPKTNLAKNPKFGYDPLDLSSKIKSNSFPKEDENSSSMQEKHFPLKDMTVFVEIYSNETNISEASYKYLEDLGAQIEKRMNKKCNLVIWKDGSIKTVERANEYGVPVVNSLWLEACMETQECPDFEKFAPILPKKHDFPFQDGKKKRKAQEPLSLEEDFNFDNLNNTYKVALKKNKKNNSEELSKIEEKIAIKLNPKKNFSDASKSIKRSQTSLGSWLVDLRDKTNYDKVKPVNKRVTMEVENNDMEEEVQDTGFNIEKILEKKEKEEQSANVRSLISKYTKSTSSFDMLEEDQYSTKNNFGTGTRNTFTMLDSPKKSEESSDDEKRNKGKYSFDDDEEDIGKNKKNPVHRSFSMGAQDDFLPKTYSLTTRLFLKEEEKAFNERKEKEKTEAAENKGSYGKSALDISVTTRGELMKLEKVDRGKISAIYSKYTGKSSSSKEDNGKNTSESKEDLVIKESAMEEEESQSDEIQVDLRNNKEINQKANVTKKKSDLMKKNTMEEDYSHEKEPPKQKGKKDEPIDFVRKSLFKTSQEKDNKFETPKKDTKSNVVVDKTLNRAGGTKTINTTKTPETKQEPPSLFKSSILNKYLDSSSSKATANSSDEKKISSFVSEQVEERKAPQRETGNSLKNKGSKEETEINYNLSSSGSASPTQSHEEPKEETFSKIIKKKTLDHGKNEKIIIANGFSEENLSQVRKFCEKFGFTLLEDELRNLERNGMLIYDGKDGLIPKNYRIAFTMMKNKPILSKKWIEESLKNGKIENLSKYELQYDSPSRERLFQNLRFYIDKEFEGKLGNVVLKQDLVRLIELCGGKIQDNVRVCDFCVIKQGRKATVEVPPHVKTIIPQWIIDSVIEGKCLNTNNVNYSSF